MKVVQFTVFLAYNAKCRYLCQFGLLINMADQLVGMFAPVNIHILAVGVEWFVKLSDTFYFQIGHNFPMLHY